MSASFFRRPRLPARVTRCGQLPAALTVSGEVQQSRRSEVAVRCPASFEMRWSCSPAPRRRLPRFTPPPQPRARLGPGSPHGGRQAQSERDLAGAEHRQLGHRGAHRPSGAGDAPGAGRARAGQGSGRARRGRRRAVGRRAWSSAATIPYLPEALQEEENQANWLTRDPEIKCYLPGVPRATYMPFPFQIFQSDSGVLHRLRVRRRGAQRLPEGSGTAAGRHVDGPVGRPLGGRHVRRRRPTASTTRAGSIAPATTTAKR